MHVVSVVWGLSLGGGGSAHYKTVDASLYLTSTVDGFLKEDDADVASGLEKATASEFGRWKQFAKLWKWEPWLSPSGSPNCASTACSSRTSGLIFFSVKASLDPENR